MGLLKGMVASGYNVSMDNITNGKYQLKLGKIVDGKNYARTAELELVDNLFMALNQLKEELDHDIRSNNDK